MISTSYSYRVPFRESEEDTEVETLEEYGTEYQAPPFIFGAGSPRAAERALGPARGGEEHTAEYTEAREISLEVSSGVTFL